MEAQKVILTEKIMIQAKYKQLALKNVLTNSAILKKYIKKYVQRYRPKDTDSYVKIVTIIMSTTLSVNFANKYIPIMKINKMILNGLDVINARDG